MEGLGGKDRGHLASCVKLHTHLFNKSKSALWAFAAKDSTGLRTETEARKNRTVSFKKEHSDITRLDSLYKETERVQE